MKKTLAAAMMSAMWLSACGGSSPGPEGVSPGSEPAASAEGTLDLAATAQGLEGTYVAGERRISFQSTAIDGDIDIQVSLNGLVLDALLRPADGVSSMDGFAAGGAATQLVDEDRELLSGLYRALNGVSREELGDTGRYLRRAVGLWAQHPTTVDLKRLVMGDEGRGYTMLCSYAKCGGAWTGTCGSYNWYSYAKHDCNWGGTSVVNNQQIAQLGDHSSCSGDEWYWTSSGWKCGEPDHWARPYVVGNCFGRCGGGCGGDTQYTLDATNHDGCVRNGHALASLYCDDQFTSASDDELFAPDCY